MGAAPSHRVRMPLRGRLSDGRAAHAYPRRGARSCVRTLAGSCGCRAGGRFTRSCTGYRSARPRRRMAAAALMPGGDAGISLVAQAGIRAVAADVAVMSGYLSMSVPFLAAALAYGVGRATSAGVVRAPCRPGSRQRRGTRGFHGKSLARINASGFSPVRNAGGPPGPHFGPRRHGPIHRLLAGRRGVHRRGRRHGDCRCGGRDQPRACRRHPALGVARRKPREPRRAIANARGEFPLPKREWPVQPRPRTPPRWSSGIRGT